MKGGLDIWQCTLHSLKVYGTIFQGILHVWICPCKNAALCQRKIALVQKDMFVLNPAFVGRYGDGVIMLKSSSLCSRNCMKLCFVAGIL